MVSRLFLLFHDLSYRLTSSPLLVGAWERWARAIIVCWGEHSWLVTVLVGLVLCTAVRMRPI
jgi:hypothetical protein